jgi:hypothetical protein
MIQLANFRTINQEVERAIKQVFVYAKQHEKDKNDFYLFLCNATYVSDYRTLEGYSPYILDYRSDIYNDIDRVEREMSYLNEHYSFSKLETVDTKESLTHEMMIYAHLWEAKTLLKQLCQLSNLCSESEYNWNIEIPKTNKFQFFSDIIDSFDNTNLDIGRIIKMAYNTQIRNAFAHSDFSFSLEYQRIYLNNYEKEKEWMMRSININDWTKKFCYSFLLDYYIMQCFNEEIQNLPERPIEINLRNGKGEKKKGVLTYDKNGKGFSGRITEATKINGCNNKLEHFESFHTNAVVNIKPHNGFISPSRKKNQRRKIR